MYRLLTLFIVALTAIVALGAPPRWENVDVPPRTVEQRVETDTPEIAVVDGYIYVTSSRPVAVKVFTILGQLVSQESIPAGVNRLRLNAKGIYILKIGSLTRRVTI